MDQEVGSIFSDSLRIQIVWNASNALFHNEFVNLNITCMDDFNGDYETCKTKLLLAKQHASNKDSENKSGKGKHDKGGKEGAKSQKDTSKPGSNGGKVEYGYCGGAHWQANCFKMDPITGPANQPRGPQTPNSTLRIATVI